MEQEEQNKDEIKEINIDYKDKALRAMADLDNYKKRIDQEKQSFVEFATLNIINDFLPIYNQLQQAINHIPKEHKNDQWVKGILMISNQFKNVLKQYNIEQYDVIGKEFDHNIMEAVMTEKDEKKPDNIVLKEIEPGYKMNGNVVRYSKVIVNKLTN